jgi:serine protease
MFQINLVQMTKALLRLLFLVLTFNVYSQGNTYYWSGNRKIELRIDSTTFILLTRSVGESESIVKNISGVKSVKLLKSDFLVVVLDKKNDQVNQLKNNNTIKSIGYSYLTTLNRKIIPTGEILVQPKGGISISNVISKFQGTLSIQSVSQYGDYILRVENKGNVLEIANSIYENGLVEYAHPNFLADIALNQNDPLYPEQYYLNNTGQFGGTTGIDINGPETWALSNGINNVRVAVIDDGVENHEDINGRVLQGFTPLVNGSHGQQVAGIIAATTNNTLGIAGITPCAQIVPVNIFNGGEAIQDLVNAIDFAWNQGQADVLSNSWSFNDSDAEFDAITQAIARARTQGRGGLGAIVVFSSGNNQQNFDGVMFPGRANGVVTVGAIDRNGNIWNYSSRGASMDLVAPSGNVNNAGDVRTTDRMEANGLVAGNYVTTFGGTSAACPQVSGVAALMLSINPNLTEAQIVNILRNTATDMGALGFDNTFGTGRLNAQAAIQQVLPTIAGANILCTANSDYTLSFIPANATVTWVVSPSGYFATTNGANINGTGGTATLRAASNYAGSATLSFIIQGNCNTTTISRTIWVGFPQISNQRLDGSSYYGPTYICPGSHWLQVTPIGTTNNANWTVQSGVPFVVSPNYLDFYMYSNVSSIAITANASNACGIGPNASFYLMKKTWGCPSSFSIAASPNPVADELTVTSISTSDVSDAQMLFGADLQDIPPRVRRAVLLDGQAQSIVEGQWVDGKFKLNVKELKKGVYFLHIYVDDQIFKEQIIVE